MRPKVALMTIFQVPNYGSVLQTFATQALLSKLGYDCTIINYRYPNEWHYNNGFIKSPFWRNLIKKIANLTGIYRQVLENKLGVFRRTRLNLSKSYHNLDSLRQADWEKYSAIISGSDQLWNPIYLKGDSAFMLSFTDTVPKISIASSFAVKDIPPHLIEKYRRYLSRFSAISVREQNGADIITKTLSLQTAPKVILDPTLLLSREEWINALNISQKPPKDRYILMYILSYAFNPYPDAIEIAKRLKDRYNCTRIITFSNSNSPEVTELGAESQYGCSIEEFLYYIRHAEVVLTSSFHGTAYAANFGRPLISLTPSNGDDRQITLLKSLAIEKCSVTVGSKNPPLNPEYDIIREQTQLGEIRRKDIRWIEDNLQSITS